MVARLVAVHVVSAAEVLIEFGAYARGPPISFISPPGRARRPTCKPRHRLRSSRSSSGSWPDGTPPSDVFAAA